MGIEIAGMMIPAGPIIEQKPNGMFCLPDPPIVEECDIRRIVTDVRLFGGLGQIDAKLLWRIIEINSESP